MDEPFKTSSLAHTVTAISSMSGTDQQPDAFSVGPCDPIAAACAQLAAAMQPSQTTTKEVCERRLASVAKRVVEELANDQGARTVAAAIHFLSQTAAAEWEQDDVSWLRPCLLVLLELAVPTVRLRASAFPLLQALHAHVAAALEAGPAPEPPPPPAPSIEPTPVVKQDDAVPTEPIVPATWKSIGDEWVAVEMQEQLQTEVTHLNLDADYPRFWLSPDGKKCKAILRFGRGRLAATIATQIHAAPENALRELIQLAGVVPAECRSFRTLLEELLPDPRTRPEHWEVYNTVPAGIPRYACTMKVKGVAKTSLPMASQRQAVENAIQRCREDGLINTENALKAPKPPQRAAGSAAPAPTKPAESTTAMEEGRERDWRDLLRQAVGMDQSADVFFGDGVEGGVLCIVRWGTAQDWRQRGAGPTRQEAFADALEKARVAFAVQEALTKTVSRHSGSPEAETVLQEAIQAGLRRWRIEREALLAMTDAERDGARFARLSRLLVLADRRQVAALPLSEVNQTLRETMEELAAYYRTLSDEAVAAENRLRESLAVFDSTLIVAMAKGRNIARAGAELIYTEEARAVCQQRSIVLEQAVQALVRRGFATWDNKLLRLHNNGVLLTMSPAAGVQHYADCLAPAPRATQKKPEHSQVHTRAAVSASSKQVAANGLENHKGMLLELCQKHRWPSAVYVSDVHEVPVPSTDPSREWDMTAKHSSSVTLETPKGKFAGQASDLPTRRSAEQAAAAKLLSTIPHWLK